MAELESDIMKKKDTGEMPSEDANIKRAQVASADSDYHVEIVWRNVILLGYAHLTTVFTMIRVLFGHYPGDVLIMSLFLGYLSALGITAGAHRLWSHKSYKAKIPLQMFLAVLQTMAGQNSIHEWSRDHRVHHKFTETNADPHNAKRGFFFSHIGWLMCKKHPDVTTRGKAVSMKDLEADPIVMFQDRYYPLLATLACFIFPTVVFKSFGISLLDAWNLSLCRYVISLQVTWMVNSVAHLWGMKPYDKSINPVENKVVSLLGIGEGYHNYHHVFPWDYKASEIPYHLNVTSVFIDLMAYIGQAYDLKSVPPQTVWKRAQRTGDGSHPIAKAKTKCTDDSLEAFAKSSECPLWGWDDEDASSVDKSITTIQYPSDKKE